MRSQSMSHIQIGITGGIGSGKSVVSRILRTMQYPVYDTDLHARRLMDSPDLRHNLTERWGLDIINEDGTLNRALLASIVFNNPAELAALNNMVHPAVRRDYARWVEQQSSRIVFVESAILHQAGMADTLHYVWLIDADKETRIERVMQRNNMPRQEVEARIASQHDAIINDRTRIIINDNIAPVLPQIIKFLNEIVY